MATIYCIARSEAHASRITTRLRRSGFEDSAISVLYSNSEGRLSQYQEAESLEGTTEGAAVGAAAGVLAGGTLGWMVGLGALAIPGVAPLIAAGPIVGALTGAVGVGTLGGLAGALVGLGVSQDDAGRYGQRIEEGGLLLAVRAKSATEAGRAEEVMRAEDAEDITDTYSDVP